jgi:RHS repeat-associated protein
VGGSDPANFNDLDRARWKGALYLAPEAGLYYMRARWYEPRSGRFLSEDPIGLAGGLNPYVFAGADGINGSDPTGAYKCSGESGHQDPGRWIRGQGLEATWEEGAWHDCGQPYDQSSVQGLNECVQFGGVRNCPDPLAVPEPPRAPRDLYACLGAVGATVATAGLDATFFMGGWEVKALERLVPLLRGTATNIARQGGWARLGRLVYRGYVVARDGASSGAWAALGGQVFSDGVAVGLGGGRSGFLRNLADFIPGPATFSAIARAYETCR